MKLVRVSLELKRGDQSDPDHYRRTKNQSRQNRLHIMLDQLSIIIT